MKREDIEKLLGGYATGTLTAAEREALLAAALEDQQLFEALAREEPLRELLQDPVSRGQLLAALDDVPEPWYYRKLPPGLIAAAAALIVVGFVGIEYWPQRQAAPLTVVARAPQPQPERSPLPTSLRPLAPLPTARPGKSRPALDLPPALPPVAVADALTAAQVSKSQLFAPSAAVAPVETALVAGTVRDPAQAIVAGATVTVTNLATDSNTTARTDERGEFRTPPVRAGEYSVRVEAPGFKEFDQRGVVLRTGEVRQLDAVLQVGAAAESVQVAVATPGVGGQAGQGKNGPTPVRTESVTAFNPLVPVPPAPAAAPPPPPPLAALAKARAFEASAVRPGPTFGLRYSVLKKLPGGQFSEIDPQQELDRRDEVVIRLQSSDPGYLYVFQKDSQNRWRPIGNDRLTPYTPYSIPRTGTVRGNGSGAKEFFVTFSRLPLNVTLKALAVRSGSGQPAEGAPGPGTSIVTNIAEPALQRVAFPITLKYK